MEGNKKQMFLTTLFTMFCMTCVMTLVMTWMTLGFGAGFLGAWISKWALAFVIAFPVSALIRPVAGKLVKRFCEMNYLRIC